MYEIKGKAKSYRESYTAGMCVNFIPPTRQLLLDFFGVEAPELDWPPESWQDYRAPILINDGTGTQALLANYGFVPKRHMPLGIRLSTLNARAETIGQLHSYKHPWHAGQLCLVPMQAFFEPCYESGKAERWRIALGSHQPFAVAGLWRTWAEEDGSLSHAFTQITINADDHPLMRRMHKPGDEKRNLVIIEPEHYQDWLTCRDPELARSWLANYPAERMVAEAVPKTNKAPPLPGTLDLFS